MPISGRDNDSDGRSGRVTVAAGPGTVTEGMPIPVRSTAPAAGPVTVVRPGPVSLAARDEYRC